MLYSIKFNNNFNYLIKRNADFKFLPSNRVISSSVVDQTSSSQDIPASLVVCWNQSHQMLFYPLTKVNKGLFFFLKISKTFRK